MQCKTITTKTYHQYKISPQKSKSAKLFLVSQRSMLGGTIAILQSCAESWGELWGYRAVCADAWNWLLCMWTVERWLCSQWANEVCPCQWVTHSTGASLVVLKKEVKMCHAMQSSKSSTKLPTLLHSYCFYIQWLTLLSQWLKNTLA